LNRFMVSMYGGFNSAKLKRDFRKGFYGIEAGGFPDTIQAEILFNVAQEEGFAIGVHYPFIRKNSTYRDPFLIHPDVHERNKAFDEFEAETEYAAKKGAKYILTHLPKPVLVSRSLDLTNWRFSGEEEWMYEDAYPVALLKEVLEEVFERLEGMAKAYGIGILLEQDAIPTVFTANDLLPRLFEKYGKVKACLDIGRLHFQSGADEAFNSLQFAEKMAPFTQHVHLWDCNPSLNISGHHPVLPHLRPEDGWVDVAAYLDIIFKAGNDITILFEHRSDLISDEQLEECYNMIYSLLNR